MKCPEGKYFCNDRQKCMPIPKGTRVRKDGQLVKEASVSKKQQRFFGMVRAAQKGEMKNPSPEVSKVADDISKKDAKKFAKTKHKGLPEKKKINEGEYGKLRGYEKTILQGGLKVRSGASYDRELARLVKMYPGFKVEEVTLEGVARFDKLMKAIKGSDVKKDKEVKLMKIAGKVKDIPEEVSRKRKPSAIKKKKKLEKLLIDKEVKEIQQETYATYQQMIDAGWEMTGEGIWWPPQNTETISEKMTFKSFRGVLDRKKKKEERKPEKAMDAGAKARRKLKRKEHAKYVSGSEDNVPDDIRDHKEYTE